MKGVSGLSRVKDFHVRPSAEIVALIDAMGKGGGFMAKNLYEVASTLTAMSERRGCTKFLSFPGAIVATGVRGQIVDMVRQGLVDVTVTTCGSLDHDIARSIGDYYEGDFDMDDAKLKKKGYHRLGNILVPVESYGPAIEKFMQGLLSRMYREGVRSITTEQLCSEIGRELRSKSSFLYWAHVRKVPVFVPGITDGAVGSQLWLFNESHRDFRIDLMGDERRLSDITSESKETGALVLGGGISKHHVIWWNLFKGGLDWACYITTAAEFDGSLSGARLKEAISWGKVKENARQASLYAEVTTVLPFILSYVLSNRKKSENH